MKWYVEVYGTVDFTVPVYKDPTPHTDKTFDSSELEARLKTLEDLLRKKFNTSEEQPVQDDGAAITEDSSLINVQPGFTTIRTLTYKNEQLEIPYFLRDAFLLPQRFDKSETFLIRLGAEQQARIMSELPNNLEGLHKHVKRYNEKNDENLFIELKTYIEEEKARRQLMMEQSGELFSFTKMITSL